MALGRSAAGCGAAPTKRDRSRRSAPPSTRHHLIDTAPVYGFGRSEEIVGKALADGLARDVILATKVGLEWKDGKIYPQRQPRAIMREIEDSLRRLRTDVIDLYQVHWPDPETPIEETARRCASSTIEGTFAPSASAISRPRKWTSSAGRPLDALQPPYNLFERDDRARSLPYCGRARHCDAGLWRALPRPSRRAHVGRYAIHRRRSRRVDPKFQPPRFAQYLAAVGELTTLARERFGKSVLGLALRWVLDQGPTIALWGARHPGQLDPIDEIDGWHIDEASKHDIDAILKRCIKDPASPQFMAPPLKRPREARVV